MAIRSSNNNSAYGLNNALQDLAPLPIFSKREPNSNDLGQLGQQWIYNDLIWELTSKGTWTQLATGGSEGIFDTLTVLESTTLNGPVTINSGGANIDMSAANITMNGSSKIEFGTTSTPIISIGESTTHTSLGVYQAGGTSQTSVLSGTGGIVIDSGSSIAIGYTHATSIAIGGSATQGSIDITAGYIAATPASFSTANNGLIGACSFSGVTVAQGAEQQFTIASDSVNATSNIILCVANNEISGDAIMTLTGVVLGANLITVNTINGGGPTGLTVDDTVIISFIILS